MRAFDRATYCFVAISLLLFVPLTAPWLIRSPSSLKTIQRTSFLTHHAQHPPILDVDFEPVEPNTNSNDEKTKQKYGGKDDASKSLIDLSLEADTDFKEARIPFIDCSSDSDEGANYIDVKLAFIAELDGVKYGIGIPFDSAAAITFEKKDGSVEYISPDDDKNEELMQIMAAQLKEHVGDDLGLRRTPRVLTISGPLDNYTRNWKETLLPAPVDAKTLMDSSDEE